MDNDNPTDKICRSVILDELSKVRAADLMVPRSEVILININSTFSEVIDLVVSDGHSRLPVFSEKIDNISGILYVKDLLPFFKTIEVDFNIAKILRKPLFVSENKMASELLQDFRNSHLHIAIVVDEYGTMMGIITLEDILEEIVGDISDEYDTEDTRKNYHEVTKNEYLVNPRMTLDEFNGLMKSSLKSKDVDTIGGFLIGRFGYVPKQGETIKYRNLHFEIRHALGSRIKEVYVKKVKG
jgi:Mg2+/Co2+ transporter CorC